MLLLVLWLLVAGQVAAAGRLCEQRVAVASLEAFGTLFSGNGVYTQSIVRSLLMEDSGVCVGLLGGYDHREGEPEPLERLHESWPVPVTPWRDLTMAGGWRSFVDGAEQYQSQVHAFQPDVVLCIDWHGCDAWERAWGPWPQPLVVFFNFRVFSASHELHGPRGAAAFYRDRERAASRRAAAILALARQDLTHLARLSAGRADRTNQKTPLVGAAVVLPCLRDDVGGRSAASTAAPGEPSSAAGNGSGIGSANNASQAEESVLGGRPKWLTPLQTALAGTAAAGSARAPAGDTRASDALRRRFLTCCVRLSPEKRPDAFVRVVELLARWHPSLLRGISPVLCLGSREEAGAVLKAARQALAAANATDVDASVDDIELSAFSDPLQWQADLVLRLWRAAPHAEVVTEFLGAAEIDWLFHRTLLNVHPPVYDAYGMTVAEAGAFGAPTLLHAATAAEGSAASIGDQVAFAWPGREGPLQPISAAEWEQLSQSGREAAAGAGAGVLQLLAPVDGALTADLSDDSLALSGEDATKVISQHLHWLMRGGEGPDQLRARLKARVLSWDVGAMGRRLLLLLAEWRRGQTAG